MTPHKGYYCLIQYCPDLSRQEAANVGVVLFCPELAYLRARTARSNDRIRRFFGSADNDWTQINALKGAIEDRLEVEGQHFRTLQDLEQFVATRGNEIQITPPRPVKVFDPAQDLQLLFDRLVGGRAKKDNTALVRRALAEAFAQANVEPLLRKEVTVCVPAFRRQLTVPYGFQNGRFNLIQPARFQGIRPSSAITRTCRYAVEGHSLFDHADEKLGPLQLLVVAEFGRQQQDVADTVHGILQEHQVRLYSLEQLDTLVEEIRATGKLQTA